MVNPFDLGYVDRHEYVQNHTGRACRGVPVDVFMPLVDGTYAERKAHNDRARSYCDICPVKIVCESLTHMLSEQPEGVWGGVSKAVRQKRATEARRVAA